MPLTREKKAEVLQELGEIMKTDGTIAFINFHGVGVSDTTALRKQLREQGVSLKVAKKTLISRALADAGFDAPELDGEIALAYGQDALAPAREVYSFAQKAFAGAKEGSVLSLVGGIYQGALVSAEHMNTIAQIPPLEVLYAQFVNLINSPLQRFAVALGQIAEQKG